MESRRERILRLLRESGRPLTVHEIAAALGIPPNETKSIYEDLKHLARTIRRRSKGREILVMVPPRCKTCGYVFKDLEEPRKPSRCPRCRGERIEPPAFTIITSD